ncbi:MAG TPA: single-stranded-DNA-specific exonuclease RecJ [Chitinophagaceae bacterium]|nr:single-stranded-DNA-specific exonuclease RecJ [Chitinophagaceae bacterium]
MEKRWKILAAEESKVITLQEQLKIHPALCRILVQRGIETFGQAKDYFRPQITSLHSPWLMKDMDKAAGRVISAINNNEKILVYGDYDVDGTTAVACMFQFLRKFHPNLDFYIPHRYREGYGISKEGIDFARDNGFTLIISLDCGIKSADLVAYAKGMGIDFVICDHHLPDDKLPPAIAILNPKQKDCNYPFKELCGCGVGFKLITALCEKLNLPADYAFEYLDLLATAIAADIVPISGENRILAFHGLVKANKNPNYGIRALAKLSGLVRELHITNLVFMIAPRVNAAGRMDDASKAVRMFVAESEEEALHYAEMLHSDNTDRKEADSSITAEALALISGNEEWKTRRSTVLFQPHWHKGVVGIVASRLIEHYHRPTIVLTRSGDYAAGSARSVPGFNLYEAVHACREHLLGYGGHFAAAGMTLELAQVEAFREKFETVITATIDPSLLVPEIVVDTCISLKDIQTSFYNILCQMEPFGPENLRPVFIARNVMDTGWSKIAKEQHIRFSLKQDDTTITGIGFNMAAKFDILQQKKPLDVVFKIEENEWQGQSSLQLKVIDIRLSEG